VELILSCGWLAIAAWLILRAFNQRRLLPSIVAVSATPAGAAASVAVIVPSRDEEANIGPCLQGLVAQDYPAEHLRVLVVDDHSADATPAIATAMARIYPRLRVLSSPSLPHRWIGKSHACWIGACAVPDDAQWVCFVDADVRLAPHALASAVTAAGSAGLDLLSLMPRHELGSFAERLLIPCGLYILAFSQDLRKTQSPHGDAVSATGQFMLVRRTVYEAIGGHAAVHDAICEDAALARLVKRAGGSVALCDGKGLISARMYTGWRTLWPGFAKNLVDMLGGPLATITTALCSVVLAWAALIIPLIDAVGCGQGVPGACVGMVPALAGSAAAFALHIAGALYFRIPPWFGLLFPLGYAAGALLAIDSVQRRWRGRVSWKGRTYP
jgi:chlorobactene glucosyltransferase